MYHSITIDNKNTYSDWYLVPDGRQVISMPSVKTNLVEVPGASGTLDLSQILTGYPVYNNREGELKFHVLNDKPKTWAELYSEIANYIHGKRMRVVLEDDPDYYYEGILSLNSWENNNDGTWSDIVIGYILDPYKYYKTLKTYSYTLSGGSRTLSFQDDSIGRMPVIPTISVSSAGTGGITLTANNSELGISNLTKNITHAGTFKYYDMVFSKISSSNTNSLVISGNGNITLNFIKGDL